MLAGSGAAIGAEKLTPEALLIETSPSEVITQPEEQLNSPIVFRLNGPTAAIGVLKL